VKKKNQVEIIATALTREQQERAGIVATTLTREQQERALSSARDSKIDRPARMTNAPGAKSRWELVASESSGLTEGENEALAVATKSQA
jgi:hypothetical protein